jgi:hypothetical protein
MAGEDWRTAIADDQLRANPALKDFPDVQTLAKSFVETKALVGASLRLPGPDAGEDVKAAFRDRLKQALPDLVEVPKDPEAFLKLEGELFERLGRPKEPKDYAPPKDVQLSDDVLAALRAEAQAEGLTKKQFEARAKRWAEGATKATESEKAELAALKKDLGDAFDERTAAARAVAEKLGIPKDAAASMPARQLRVWAGVAKAIGGEGNHVGEQRDGTGGKLTPAEHAARAQEIRTRLMSPKERLDHVTREQLIAKMVEHETEVAKFEGREL